MIKIPASDKQYVEDIIESVTSEARSWTLHFGWCLWVQKNDDLPDFEPKAGDTLRCYGKGLGFSVRGIEILQGGKSYVLRYQTEAEAEATPGRWLAEANISNDPKTLFSVDSTSEHVCEQCGCGSNGSVISDSFRTKADADLVVFLHNNALELFDGEESPVEHGTILADRSAVEVMNGHCPDCGENVYHYGNGRRCRACLTVYTPSIHLGELVMLTSGRQISP